jgi:hypothetical protein
MLRFGKLIPFLVVLSLSSWGQAKLKIENVRFREYEDGPIIHSKPQYLAGSEVYLDFQVSGFLVVEKALVRSMDIGWTFSVLDPQGRLAVPVEKGESSTEIQNEDKDWMPKIRAKIPLPPSAVSGTYRMELQLEDRKAKTTAKGEIPFQVNGRSFAESDGLAIVQLKFFRGEDATQVLRTPAYRPGEAIHFGFDLVGFQLNEKNGTKLTVDLAVKDPKGRVVINGPAAIKIEEAEAFYPPRFFHEQLSLELEAKNEKGTYTLTLTANDALSGKSVSSDFIFSLE